MPNALQPKHGIFSHGAGANQRGACSPFATPGTAASRPTHKAVSHRADTATSPAARTVNIALRCLLAATLASFSLAALPFAQGRALAEDIDTNPQPDEFQQRIEDSAAAYNNATKRAAELDQAIADNDAAIKELQEKLPEQRERANAALVELYKSQQDTATMLDIVLSSANFSEFITRVDYFNTVTRANMSEVEALGKMQDDLTQAQANLEAEKAEADQQAQAAQDALAEAQAARVEAQRKAAEEARRAAEEAEAAQKAASSSASSSASASSGEASADASDSDDSDNSGSSAAETPAESGGAASTDTADWTSDEDRFVSEWAGRINNYLAGTPLAGQGETFARAAWTYGVDPRWSPAISYVESSCGAYCFQPHNAWGWGSVSWGSWEEAINSHVAGLARGYGYTLTYEAAKKYCPPNADHWYSTCLAQMNRI